MEKAILLDNLNRYQGPQAHTYLKAWGSRKNGLDRAMDRIRCLFREEETLSLFYFGSEFCEYCLPDQEELGRFLAVCTADHLKPILVTPPVSGWGLKKIEELLEYFTQNVKKAEIVVNDVGVLELLREKYPDCSVVVGRIFDKLSHDPRILTEDMECYYGENGLKFARTPGILSEYAQKAFSGYGAERYEFDLPKTGIDLPKTGHFSLYWPYQYLTTGRVCMMRASLYKGKDKFLVGNKECPGVCRNLQVEMRKPANGFRISNGRKVEDTYLFQKGNTIFYLYEEENFNRMAEQFDRLVLQI